MLAAKLALAASRGDISPPITASPAEASPVNEFTPRAFSLDVMMFRFRSILSCYFVRRYRSTSRLAEGVGTIPKAVLGLLVSTEGTESCSSVLCENK